MGLAGALCPLDTCSGWETGVTGCDEVVTDGAGGVVEGALGADAEVD